ncbi:3-isopropylmalate dehydrogenase [Candidatus Neomarinimicrobiota bacterium]
MTEYKIAVLPGDGIGPEVMVAALAVLDEIAVTAGLTLDISQHAVGGLSIDENGTPLTDATLDACYDSDAVLLGAIGGPKWDNLPQDKKPERGLLRLREALCLYTNLRPAKVYDAMVNASSLKPEYVADTDLIVVRELTGGIYFGEPRGFDQDRGWNTLVYTRHEVERIARAAFELAGTRNGRVTSVDKANVLDSSQFWRDVVNETHKDYPKIELSHMYVDNAAMQLIREPKQFDVIVTQNMFGDILSDAAAMITGSLGMLPSASLGDQYALYEPVHGTAPDIAGQNIANPIAMIASVGMLVHSTFKLPQLAQTLSNAIDQTLASGYRTADIAEAGGAVVSTTQMCDQVLATFKTLASQQTELA